MDVPLIVALISFVAVMLASSAVFLYMNSKQALQVWRRRADGTPSVNEPGADDIGDQLKGQLHAILEWLARMNQPANVEEARATRQRLINAGYRSGKALVF